MIVAGMFVRTARKKRAIQRLQPKRANYKKKYVFQHVPSAFTLIELIIVVTFITIISAVGMETFKTARLQLQHENAVNTVVSMMQKARNLAINSQLYKNYTELATAHGWDQAQAAEWEKVVPSGYGIQITRPHSKGFGDHQTKGYGGEITLFVDNRYVGTSGCDDLKIPTSPYYLSIPSVDTCPYNTSTEDIIMETYHISDDISVEVNAVNGIHMIFLPPFGDVILYKNFDTSLTNLSQDESISSPPTDSFWKTDKNTAMIRLTSRLLPSTSSTIYFNRLSGHLEVTKN